MADAAELDAAGRVPGIAEVALLTEVPDSAGATGNNCDSAIQGGQGGVTHDSIENENWVVEESQKSRIRVGWGEAPSEPGTAPV